MTLFYPSLLWLIIPLGLFFVYRKKSSLMIKIHIFILMLIVLAESRPVLKKGLQENHIDAQDIIIALDISYSMKADDILPNRYDYAKEMINSFLKKNKKDNIMFIGFTTNPLLLSPPTTDHALISMALESLNPKYILTKGTSLQKLFNKLSAMHQHNKELILITDGGEDKEITKMADTLKKINLHLNVVAMGTTAGSTIPASNGYMLKDKDNHLVISRINPSLEKLVSKVEGNYIQVSGSAQNTAEELQNIIENKKNHTNQIKKIQYSYTELYQIPLFIALMLFLVLHTSASKYLIIILALLGVHAEASFLDGYWLNKAYTDYSNKKFLEAKNVLQNIDKISLQSKITEANTYYKLGAYKKAINLYMSIHSTKESVKQILFYNTANAYTKLKEYDKAKMYYTKALQLGEDKDAIHNLSLIVFLNKKKKSSLGMAHPKSQSSATSKSKLQEESKSKKKSNNKEQTSSGSGTGGEKKQEKSHKKEKIRLKYDKNAKKQPLSSKVYELINKGYIHESQPW